MKNIGFTLIELLVVVAILALIAGTVVALAGGLTTGAAITSTMATQKQLTNTISEYYQAHGKLMPDGFDSLIRSDYATTGVPTATYDLYPTQAGPLELIKRTTNTSLQDGSPTTPGTAGFPRGFIYTGLDADQNFETDAGAVSKGLTVMSWSGQGVHTLTVAKLNAADKAALNKMGITYVYDIANNRDLDANGNLTYLKRTLNIGDPIVIMDPSGLGSAYEAFTSLTDLPKNGTTTNATTGVVTPVVTAADKLSMRPHFIVLGIGPNCTLVGDRRGGVQEAPTCSTIVTWITAKPRGGNDYYNRYMAVVKLPADPKDVPAFAGVLDCNGWPARAAGVWYSRNLE